MSSGFESRRVEVMYIGKMPNSKRFDAPAGFRSVLSEGLAAVLCIDCGFLFTCVADSPAHKEGHCNRCWARLTVEHYRESHGKP